MEKKLLYLLVLLLLGNLVLSLRNTFVLSSLQEKSHNQDRQLVNNIYNVSLTPEVSVSKQEAKDKGKEIAEKAKEQVSQDLQKRHILKTAYGDLEIFPPDNPWNQDISDLPVHPRSAFYIMSIGPDANLHPDFGTTWRGKPIGIPYNVIHGKNSNKVYVDFQYEKESDPGPYPIPANPLIEAGDDRHLIVIDYSQRKLYELFAARKENGKWKAGSGAIFDLTSNELRPEGWTSADAAGLPIFPGLVRYQEVMEQGEIRHALRFTARQTQRGYIFPARHFASKKKDPRLPPMGLRVRLKADFDTSGFPKAAQVILQALKKYGMILADNGGNWFISGVPDSRWDDDVLATLKKVRGEHLEAVDTGEIVTK